MSIYRKNIPTGRENGSILIGLIIIIMIFASLTAAMLNLTSTSNFLSVETVLHDQAYYLAESGYRYAMNQYLNPTTGPSATRLLSLNNRTFTLANNAGQFHLDIFPYFFTLAANPAGTQALSAQVPGQQPQEIQLTAGKLTINANTYDYTSAVINNNLIVFTMAQTMPFFPVGSEILPTALSSSDDQNNLVEGGLIQLQPGSAEAFPLRNGSILINQHLYIYKKLDRELNQLKKIYDPATTNMTPLSITANTKIILEKYIKLLSIGILGEDFYKTSRTLNYSLPLPGEITDSQIIFHDKFETVTHWENDSSHTLGAHEIQQAGGDAVLQVTGTEASGSSSQMSLIALDWSTTNLDFTHIHQNANHYLSYEAQVKMGFYNPIPVLRYYAAGISFRLDDNLNAYGISFLRGKNNPASETDHLDDDLVPENNLHAIVLWQQLNSGQDKIWLAYKSLEHVFFHDDMESTGINWDSQTPWGLTSAKSHSGSQCWTDSPGSMYNNDLNTSITSKGIDLSCSDSIFLSFWHQGVLNVDDKGRIEISADQGNTWQILKEYQDVEYLFWYNEIIDISAFAGQPKVKIRFRLQTNSLGQNDGWYLDDVKVYRKIPVQESTLLVKLRESASLQFNSGQGIPMKIGDELYGTASNTIATIIDGPHLSSGTWSDGTATGLVMLNALPSGFQIGETIKISGTSGQAIITGFSSRSNFIKAFYAEAVDNGTPSADYLDHQKQGLARNQVKWPPDPVSNWSAESDFFTLIQWDQLNPMIATAESLPSESEPKAIIRSWEPDLLTPENSTFSQPELGLHTLGNGSKNVYFDDFAVKATVASDPIYLPPVQE